MTAVAPLRSLFTALVVAALALPLAACGKKPPPQPPQEPSEPEGVTLRYMATEQPLQQDVQLQLTQTRLGLYIEADLKVTAELRLAAEGEGLRTQWAVLDVSDLSLTGTVEPGDVDRVRTLLTEQAKGTTLTDAHGLVDVDATAAESANQARAQAVSGKDAPAAASLLMSALAEQLRLPQLPAAPLRPGEPLEIAEESETVVTDAELVLPTTTVHRFTLARVDELQSGRLAEIALVIASVAQPELDPEAETEAEETEPAAELQSQAEGTLVFDLDRNLPVSLELSGTETLRIGEQEVERSLQVRATFASQP